MEVRDEHGETTLVVDAPRLAEAASYLRDELGFDFLSDMTATDYLGWGREGVSGYIGTPGGRDLNTPSTRGLQRMPRPKPRRFSVSYHLLAVRSRAPRVRLQAWIDDGPTHAPGYRLEGWVGVCPDSCAESLARFKVPKRFEFVAELPRTASGKLLRRALR